MTASALPNAGQAVDLDNCELEQRRVVNVLKGMRYVTLDDNRLRCTWEGLRHTTSYMVISNPNAVAKPLMSAPVMDMTKLELCERWIKSSGNLSGHLPAVTPRHIVLVLRRFFTSSKASMSGTCERYFTHQV